MKNKLAGVTGVTGRVFLVTVFLLSAVGNKIPNFAGVAQYMGTEGMPAPQVLLAGGIVFLLAGSVSILLGYQARVGAGMLLLFLVLATYFFHDFWTVADAAERQAQTIHFLKNLSIMGAMLVIMANGAGKWTLDARKRAESEQA